MTDQRRERLLAAVEQLEPASKAEFAEGVQPEDGADYRVIANTQLRSQLIGARFAEGIQSPKGPQKIASIIRIYPDGDAPEPVSRSQRTACTVARVSRRAQQQKPTFEELKALVTRVEAMRGHVARETSMTIDEEIANLQKRVATVGLDTIGSVLPELTAAVAKKADIDGFALPEAIRRVAADREFAPRVYLSLIAA